MQCSYLSPNPARRPGQLFSIRQHQTSSRPKPATAPTDSFLILNGSLGAVSSAKILKAQGIWSYGSDISSLEDTAGKSRKLSLLPLQVRTRQAGNWNKRADSGARIHITYSPNSDKIDKILILGFAERTILSLLLIMPRKSAVIGRIGLFPVVPGASREPLGC
jgi:hypothetical protein